MLNESVLVEKYNTYHSVKAVREVQFHSLPYHTQLRSSIIHTHNERLPPILSDDIAQPYSGSGKWKWEVDRGAVTRTASPPHELFD